MPELQGPGSTLPMTLGGALGSGAAQIPMGLNAPAKVDALGEMGKVYSLAEQIDQREQAERSKRDQQAIQDMLKQGASMETPQGIKSLADQLKGQVQPATYANLVKMSSQMEETAMGMRTKMAQMDEASLNALQKKGEMTSQALSSLMMNYDKEVEEKGVPSALESFNKNRAAAVNAMKQQGLVNDQSAKELMDMEPGQIKAKVQASTFWMDQLKNAAHMKLQAAQTAAANALATERGQGGSAMAAYEYAVEKYGKDSQEAKAALGKVQGGGIRNLAGVPEDQITPGERALAVGQWIQNPSSLRGLDPTYQRNVIKWADSMGITQEDVASGQAVRKFDIASAGASGRRAGNMAAVEATMPELVKNAKEASAAVPRTAFVPLNRLMQMGEGAISDPKLKAFKLANQAIASEFQQVIARGGSNVHSLQEAEKMLNTADSPEAYNAALDMVNKEIIANVKGAHKVREELAPKNVPRVMPTKQMSGDPAAQKAEQIQILQAEQKDRLAEVAKATTPAEKANAESLLAANRRELARLGVNEEPSAAPPGAQKVMDLNEYLASRKSKK